MTADGTRKQVEVMAYNFHMRLKAVLRQDQWDEMREKNRTALPHVCASHDYCDANVHMGEAFAMTMAREFDLESEDDQRLWNSAWDLAHRLYLTAY